MLTLSCLLRLLPERGGQAAEQPSPAAPPAAIPMAEIATRAAEMSNLLRSLTPTPSAEIKAIETRPSEARDKMDLELGAAASVLRAQRTLDMLQAQQLIWQRRRLQTSQWLSLLTQRATVSRAESPGRSPDDLARDACRRPSVQTHAAFS